MTTGEDFALGEAIQRGYLAGSQESILFGRNEAGLSHFHRAVRRWLGIPEDP